MLATVDGAQGAQDDLGDLFDGGGAQLTDHFAEQQLVGYLLHKPKAATETIEVIQPSVLHDPLTRRIYELILRAYDIGEEPTMESLVAGMGGEKSVGIYIARLMAEADLHIDLAEVADHLFSIAERRAVGTADDTNDGGGAPFTSKFGAQAWEDIGETGAVGYSWFVEDIFPMGEISLVFGDTGSGKSFSMFDMVMTGARGLKWNGRNVEHGLVIYVAAEAGKGFRKRKKAYAIQNKLDPLEPLPFVLLTKRPNFFHDDTDALDLIDEVKKLCRQYNLPLVCIVLDTLSALAPGWNENASQDVSMVRKRLVMVQDNFDAAIILVHHKPKGGNTPRGHGSLTADFETTVEYETVGDKRTENGKTIHKGTLRKQREGKSGIEWSFTLPVVEVGRNKWNNPETSCVVASLTVDAKKAAEAGFHATATELLFLRALFDTVVDHSRPPPAGLPKSITKVVEITQVRALMRERYISGHDDEAADGRFRVAFKRAGDALRNGAVIGKQGELIWYTGKKVKGLIDGGQGATSENAP